MIGRAGARAIVYDGNEARARAGAVMYDRNRARTKL